MAGKKDGEAIGRTEEEGGRRRARGRKSRSRGMQEGVTESVAWSTEQRDASYQIMH